MSRRTKGPIRLPRARRWSIYAVALGLWGSGLAWLVLRYFLRRPGEFGPEADPLEPWALKAHGLFAFAALWAMGVVWAAHLVNGWSAGRRRGSGGLLFGLALFLIATGYLLYYAGSDELRALIAKLHWIAGLGAPAAFLLHRFAHERGLTLQKPAERACGNAALTAAAPHRGEKGSGDDRRAEPERAT